MSDESLLNFFVYQVVAAADTEGHHKDGACGKDKYVETRSRSELVDLYGMNLGKWMSDDDE